MSKSKSTLSAFRNRQQIKDEQINYLPGDLEKNLEDYRNALEIKEKQLSDAKKILLSTKQTYDKTVAENRDLKAYNESLKQRFQQQQLQFLEKQRKYYQHKKSTPKKYKKVVYEEEEDESDPELEQEEDEESENEEIEKVPEIKKAKAKRKETSGNSIFEYINKNARRHK